MNCIIPPDKQTNSGGIWQGNWSSANDIENLQSENILYVITAIPEDMGSKNKQYQEKGITQIIINVEDLNSADIQPHFEAVYEFIEKVQPKANVLIHCAAGVSRSTTLTCSYMMKKYNKGVIECLKLIKEKRACSGPNHGFIKQLQDWEKRVVTQEYEDLGPDYKNFEF